MADPKDLLAEAKKLLGQVADEAKTDFEDLASDVEGHLRVAIAHLRALLGSRKQEDPGPVSEDAVDPDTEAEVTPAQGEPAPVADKPAAAAPTAPPAAKA